MAFYEKQAVNLSVTPWRISVPSLTVSPRTITQAGRPSSTRYPDFVPANYTELFDHYYPYVRGIVFKSGIDSQSCADVTMSILEKFFAHDVLADFNPEFTSTHGGVTRKAMFRTFLSGFVKIYVRHHRDRQIITKAREAISLDAPAGDDNTWMDYYGETHVDTYDQLMIEDAVLTVQDHLATLSDPRGRCEMLDLFNMTLEHSVTYGSPNVEILSQYFEVSETTIRNRLKALRAEIHEVFES